MKATEIRSTPDLHKWVWQGDQQFRNQLFRLSDQVVTQKRAADRTWLDRHTHHERAGDIQDRMLFLISGALAYHGVYTDHASTISRIRDYITWLETNSGAPSN